MQLYPIRKAVSLLANHKKMSEIRERYVNPFTDFGRFAARFKKLFGEDPNTELQSYEDSLKYYRDLKNLVSPIKNWTQVKGKPNL